MASGLVNGCVLSYFEGTANLNCYTSCTLITLHCSKVSFQRQVTAILMSPGKGLLEMEYWVNFRCQGLSALWLHGEADGTVDHHG